MKGLHRGDDVLMVALHGVALSTAEVERIIAPLKNYFPLKSVRWMFPRAPVFDGAGLDARPAGQGLPRRMAFLSDRPLDQSALPVPCRPLARTQRPLLRCGATCYGSPRPARPRGDGLEVTAAGLDGMRVAP
jgi:hypothetical protein